MEQHSTVKRSFRLSVSPDDGGKNDYPAYFYMRNVFEYLNNINHSLAGNSADARYHWNSSQTDAGRRRKKQAFRRTFYNKYNDIGRRKLITPEIKSFHRTFLNNIKHSDAGKNPPLKGDKKLSAVGKSLYPLRSLGADRREPE